METESSDLRWKKMKIASLMLAIVVAQLLGVFWKTSRHPRIDDASVRHYADRRDSAGAANA
jgi:hypothetical protein